jgi:tetratricopeptide (TPR) repeat protein
MAKKDKSGIEIIESAEALQNTLTGAENVIEKYKKPLSFAGGFILALVLSYFAYKYWNDTQEKEAQVAMYDAFFSFEADSTAQALKGQGGNEGLLAISDNFGSTKAGKLASLSSGIILMKQGKFKEAIERLDKFSSSDQVVQGKAYTLIGDCYLELKDNKNAISYYEKAVNYKANKFVTPGYMMKLALAHQEAKDVKSAISVYSDIISKYPASQEVLLAKKFKARLETELGE